MIALRRQNGSIRAQVRVSAQDIPRVSRHRWRLSGGGYAIRGKKTTTLMHREILGLEPGDPRYVDHINRDRLDNRRENLRIVTPLQQRQNLSSHEGAKSRFRGVDWRKERGRWRAKATLNGKTHYLGTFEEEVEAARAADAWRLENMPFAEPDPELQRLEEVARVYE